jgi:hypothetical protein
MIFIEESYKAYSRPVKQIMWTGRFFCSFSTPVANLSFLLKKGDRTNSPKRRISEVEKVCNNSMSLVDLMEKG